METIALAVNGTLMRGLELNDNLLRVGARFDREDKTGAQYLLYSINDRHPAMQRVSSGGAEISVEIWNVPAGSVATVLMEEPQGLCIGKVVLADGMTVLGVLGESALCDRGTEITAYGGWREYIASRET